MHVWRITSPWPKSFGGCTLCGHRRFLINEPVGLPEPGPLIVKASFHFIPARAMAIVNDYLKHWISPLHPGSTGDPLRRSKTPPRDHSFPGNSAPLWPSARAMAFLPNFLASMMSAKYFSVNLISAHRRHYPAKMKTGGQAKKADPLSLFYISQWIRSHRG